MAETTMGQDSSVLKALVENFVRLGRDGLATLVVPWLAIAAVDFGFVVLAIAVMWIGATAETVAGAGAGVQLLAMVQGFVIIALRVALLKTLRDVAFQGPEAVGSLGAVGRDVIGRIGPAIVVTLVVGAIITVGLILCVLPGLVALFFLAFAPYLVVAKGVGIGDALRQSMEWARRQWLLLLTAIAIAFVVSASIACVMGLLQGVGFRPSVAIPAAMVGSWVMNTVLGYLAFLWWGAVYVTAEKRHQVESLRRTAPTSGTAGSGGGDEDFDGPRMRPDDKTGPRIYERPSDRDRRSDGRAQSPPSSPDSDS